MNDSQFLSIQYRSEISPFLTMNIIMLCKLGVIYFRRYSRDEYLFSAFRSIAENICLKRFDRKQMVNEALR